LRNILGTLEVSGRNEVWELLWLSIAHHPSLEVVDVMDVPNIYVSISVREYRDQCIVRALETNRVLTDIWYTEDQHSGATMSSLILPRLALNRVEKILEVTDDRVRRGLEVFAHAHPDLLSIADYP
jgi:hypothetical protein